MKDHSSGTRLVLRSVGIVLVLALSAWGCDGDDDGGGGMFASCGDGLVNGGEQCDDGNTIACDGCSDTCQIEMGLNCCGDGIVQPPETCDDSNTVPGDGCSDTCMLESSANCTITFDGALNCPNPTEVCGATFGGGSGCVFANLPFCYDTGAFSYESMPGNTVTINLDSDLNSLLVFFASAGPAPGVMTFFDAQDVQVGAPLMSNGNCLVFMPDRQMLNFSSPVRRITFEPTGSDTVYVDTFEVNP